MSEKKSSTYCKAGSSVVGAVTEMWEKCSSRGKLSLSAHSSATSELDQSDMRFLQH